MSNDTLFYLLWFIPGFLCAATAIGAIRDDEPGWAIALCAIAIVPFAGLIAVAICLLYGCCFLIACAIEYYTQAQDTPKATAKED